MKKFGCIMLVMNVLLGGWATQFVIDAWAPLVVKHAVHAPFWPCALAGLFFGEFTIPAAVLTWLLKISGVL